MTYSECEDSDAVEVDGICFETLVPERVLTIPNKENVKTSIQFGIRVTNKTSTSYRFIFFYLLPELQTEDGQSVKLAYARNVTKAPSESDFLLANPGESLTYFIDAKFSWYDYKLRIGGYARDGGVWHFDNLKLGTYRIRFTYQNLSAVKRLYRGKTIKGLWTGLVSTPLAVFSLVGAAS